MHPPKSVPLSLPQPTALFHLSLLLFTSLEKRKKALLREPFTTEPKVGALLGRTQDHVLEIRVGVVALEIDRARNEFVRIDRAAGRTDDGSVIDDRLAVEDDRDVALVELDADVLPLARLLLGRDARHDASVIGRHVVLVHRLAEAVDDLAFVASAEVHARVGVFRNAHVVLEVEIVEVGALGNQVRAPAGMLAVSRESELVGEDPVLELPAELRLRIHRHPAVESVLEEVDRFAELRVLGVRGRNRRIPPAVERGHERAVVLLAGSGDLVALDRADEVEAPVVLERNLVALDRDGSALHFRRGPAPEDERLRLALRIAGHDHVSAVHVVIVKLQTPVAEHRILRIVVALVADTPGQRHRRSHHGKNFSIHKFCNYSKIHPSKAKNTRPRPSASRLTASRKPFRPSKPATLVGSLKRP